MGGGGTEPHLAFNLAEILITLGVLGVVAALTMPMLIANYQKKQTVESLKQAYSLLQHAYEFAQQDYGSIEYWNYKNMSNVAIRDTFFLPYFKSASVPKSTYKYNTPNWPIWSDGMKNGYIFPADAVSSCLQTPQNYLYCFRNLYNGHVIINIDINGIQKGPNRVARDIFMVGFNSDYGNRIEFEGIVTYQHCNKTSGNGNACGLKIQRDGWRIKDDYPWRSGR